MEYVSQTEKLLILPLRIAKTFSAEVLYEPSSRAEQTRFSVHCVIGVPLCAYILPGVHVEPVYMSLMLGLILGGFFYIVRPLLKLLTIPIGCLTMGLFSLALDTGVIYLMSLYLPGFSLDGPEWALAIAGILMILRCPVLR